MLRSSISAPIGDDEDPNQAWANKPSNMLSTFCSVRYRQRKPPEDNADPIKLHVQAQEKQDHADFRYTKDKRMVRMEDEFKDFKLNPDSEIEPVALTTQALRASSPGNPDNDPVLKPPRGPNADEAEIRRLQKKAGHWNELFLRVKELPEATIAETIKKHALLSSITQDFVAIAKKWSQVLVQEMFLPETRRTVKAVLHQDGDHTKLCYLVRGILFTVAQDVPLSLQSASNSTVLGQSRRRGARVSSRRGRISADASNPKFLYGGDQASYEYSNKAMGATFRGAEQASKFEDALGLHVPIQCLIEYCGFRILATPVLPIVAIRSLQYGSVKGRTDTDGEVDRELLDRVARMGQLLGLAEHEVPPLTGQALTGQGLHGQFDTIKEEDSNSLAVSGEGEEKKKERAHSISAMPPKQRSLWHTLPGDAQGWRGLDGRIYLMELGRLFPSEAPHFSKHLYSRAGSQPVFYRHLRPEFLQLLHSCNCPPLNPDVYCNWSKLKPGSSWDELEGNVSYATYLLLHHVVPAAAVEICQTLGQRTAEGEQFTTANRSGNKHVEELLTLDSLQHMFLNRQLHQRGVNMRHLGLLRSHLPRHHPNFEQVDLIILAEMVSRTLKSMVRRLCRNHFRALANSFDRIQTETGDNEAATFFPVPGSFAELSEIGVHSSSKKFTSAEMPKANVAPSSTSMYFLLEKVVSLLNLVTAADKHARLFWQVELPAQMKLRFGAISLAMSPGDANSMGDTTLDMFLFEKLVQPEHPGLLTHIILSVLDACGIRLNMAALERFKAKSLKFFFATPDIASLDPVTDVLPSMALSQASVISQRIWNSNVRSIPLLKELNRKMHAIATRDFLNGNVRRLTVIDDCRLTGTFAHIMGSEGRANASYSTAIEVAERDHESAYFVKALVLELLGHWLDKKVSLFDRKSSRELAVNLVFIFSRNTLRDKDTAFCRRFCILYIQVLQLYKSQSRSAEREALRRKVQHVFYDFCQRHIVNGTLSTAVQGLVEWARTFNRTLNIPLNGEEFLTIVQYLRDQLATLHDFTFLALPVYLTNLPEVDEAVGDDDSSSNGRRFYPAGMSLLTPLPKPLLSTTADDDAGLHNIEKSMAEKKVNELQHDSAVANRASMAVGSGEENLLGKLLLLSQDNDALHGKAINKSTRKTTSKNSPNKSPVSSPKKRDTIHSESSSTEEAFRLLMTGPEPKVRDALIDGHPTNKKNTPKAKSEEKQFPFETLETVSAWHVGVDEFPPETKIRFNHTSLELLVVQISVANLSQGSLLKWIARIPSCHSLQSLAFVNSHVSDPILPQLVLALAETATLQALDLSSNAISDKGLFNVEALNSSSKASLLHVTSLSVAQTQITNAGLVTLCKLFPNLTCLSLRGCQLITDQGVALLCSKLKLEHISVAECFFLTDHCAAALCSQNPDLRTLEIDGINVTGGTLSHTSQLYGLSLRECPQILNDQLVRFLSERQSTLKRLNLCGCMNVRDDVILSLLDDGKNNTLQTMNVSCCWQLSPDGLIRLAAGCSTLRVLVLSRLAQLTDKLLFQLLVVCPSLVYVDVRHCDKLTLHGLERLRADFGWVGIDHNLFDEVQTDQSRGVESERKIALRPLKKLTHSQSQRSDLRVTQELKAMQMSSVSANPTHGETQRIVAEKRLHLLHSQAMDQASNDTSLFETIKLGKNPQELQHVLKSYFGFVRDVQAKANEDTMMKRNRSTQTMLLPSGSSINSHMNSRKGSRRGSRRNSLKKGGLLNIRRDSQLTSLSKSLSSISTASTPSGSTPTHRRSLFSPSEKAMRY